MEGGSARQSGEGPNCQSRELRPSIAHFLLLASHVKMSGGLFAVIKNNR